MLWINLLMILVVMLGLILFAFGIMKAKDIQVFFGALIVLTPIFWLTFGFNLLPLAPIFSLSIMYFVRATESKKSESTNM